MTVILYEIRVICTDRQQHASREVGHLAFDDREDPDLRAAFESDPDLDAAEVEWLLANERIRYRMERASHRGDRVHLSNPEQLVGDPNADELQHVGVVWRFHCKTCKRNVRLGDLKLIRVLDGLTKGRGNTRPISLDVSLLPARLT